jgi:DNA mismatch repair protein MutS
LFELSSEPDSPVLQHLAEIDPDDLTPRQALETLYSLKQQLDETRQ